MNQTPQQPARGFTASPDPADDRPSAGASGLSCEAVQARFLDEPALQDPAVEEHRATCSTCASLFGSDGAPPPPPHAVAMSPPLIATRAALMAQVRQPASWSDRLAETDSRLRWVVLVVLAAGTLAVGVGGLRPDFSAYPGLRMALTLGSLAAAGLLGWGLSLRPLWRPPTIWLGLAPWLLAALPAVLAALPHAATGHPENLLGAQESAFGRAGGCLLYGTLLALPLLMSWRLLDRSKGREPARRRVAGLAAAGFANAGLQLHCPLTGSAHLWLGHVSVVLCCWLLALWVVRLPFFQRAA